MTRHHVIISGTGRAGTSFLVQLLTELKLDTGYTDTSTEFYPGCRAGLEKDIRDPAAPYIIKSPWLCDYLGEVLAQGEVAIDHAIIPMRDLFSAAESRRFVVREAGEVENPDLVRGGLWHTKEPLAQESILTLQLYKLMETLSSYDIPLTLLSFPRLATDPEYLYKKIGFLLKRPASESLSVVVRLLHNNQIDYPTFLSAFRNISRPELIHNFSNR